MAHEAECYLLPAHSWDRALIMACTRTMQCIAEGNILQSAPASLSADRGKIGWLVRRSIQAPIGNLLALLVPRWRIVPAIPLEYISNDPAVVRAVTHLAPCCPAGCCWGDFEWRRCSVHWGVKKLRSREPHL